MKRRTKARKQNRQKTKLGLPDLEHVKSAVLVSLRSSESQRSYRRSIDDFVGWYCSEPRLSLNKTVVTRYRIHLKWGSAVGVVTYYRDLRFLLGTGSNLAEGSQGSKNGGWDKEMKCLPRSCQKDCPLRELLGIAAL